MSSLDRIKKAIDHTAADAPFDTTDAEVTIRSAGPYISVKLHRPAGEGLAIHHRVFDTDGDEVGALAEPLSDSTKIRLINELYAEHRVSVTGIANMLLLDQDTVHRSISAQSALARWKKAAEAHAS